MNQSKSMSVSVILGTETVKLELVKLDELDLLVTDKVCDTSIVGVTKILEFVLTRELAMVVDFVPAKILPDPTEVPASA